MNTWKQWDRDRPKLRVVPKQAIPLGPGMGDRRPRLCIEVTNLSSFPLVVTEVGVRYRGTDRRGAILPPIVIDGKPFPRRLESRTSVSLYASPDAFSDPTSPRVRSAYAMTDCGLTFTGTSRALKRLDHWAGPSV
jgi:hypothetical protein